MKAREGRVSSDKDEKEKGCNALEEGLVFWNMEGNKVKAEL